MSELKPCPFCGGNAVLQSGERGGWFVECLECHATTSLVHSETSVAPLTDAIAAWNRRDHKEEEGDVERG